MYDLRLTIDEDSAQGRNIETAAREGHVTREEAALKLLANPIPAQPASERARRIIGAFSSAEDIRIMEEALEIAMQDRIRRNSA